MQIQKYSKVRIQRKQSGLQVKRGYKSTHIWTCSLSKYIKYSCISLESVWCMLLLATVKLSGSFAIAIQPLQGWEESYSVINLQQNTCLLAKGLICWATPDKISSSVGRRGTGWLPDLCRKALLPSKPSEISVLMHLCSSIKLTALKMRWQWFLFFLINYWNIIANKHYSNVK